MLKRQHLDLLAGQLGIDKLGVAEACELPRERLMRWLGLNYHGQMGYMERNLDKRLSPEALLPGAQSVISIFVNYYPENTPAHLDQVIARYAWGKDYHQLLKDKLHSLAELMFGDELKGLSRRERAWKYRVCVDSAPVDEKSWAVRAGLGWQGKHTNIITRELGSYGLLGEIITTESVDQYDLPVPDHCGTCTACLDACPTRAIVAPYVLDGSKCIAYATIELNPEENIPKDIDEQRGSWIFGCDVCQDVCPWNRFATPSSEPAFRPIKSLELSLPDFSEMDAQVFEQEFSNSPLNRPGLQGLQRNSKTRG